MSAEGSGGDTHDDQVDLTSEEASVNPESTSSSQGGRPAGASGPARKYFTVLVLAKNRSAKRALLQCTLGCTGKAGRVEAIGHQMNRHILEQCRFATPAIKEDLRKTLTAMAGPLIKTPSLTRNGYKQQRQISMHSFVDNVPVDKATLDQLQCRWWVTGGISFDQADNPHFLAWMEKVRPLYNTAGKPQLVSVVAHIRFHTNPIPHPIPHHPIPHQSNIRLGRVFGVY